MEKSADAFRTISEVADLLDTPAHVLRFWESRFPQIKPVKRAGGRRYYKPGDVALLAGIKRLLHDEGMTIRGVQKILREQGVRHVSGLADDAAEPAWDDDSDKVDDAGIADGQDDVYDASPMSDSDASADPDDGLFARMADPVTGAQLADATGAADRPQSPPLAAPQMQAASLPTLPTPSDTGPDGAPDATADHDSQHPAARATASLQPPETAAQPHGAAFAAATIDDSAASTEPAVQVSPTEEQPPSDPALPVSDARLADLPVDSPAVSETVAPQPATLALPPAPTADDQPERWIAAELRALRRGAFADRKAKAEAALTRLLALRDRMGDLARAPRR